MNVVKTFAMAQSSKISLVGIYYQKNQPFPTFFKTEHWKQDYNPRFLNKTETKIRKIQSPGHNAYTSNKKNLKICLRSMIKLSELSNQSLLAGGIITKPYFSLLSLLKNLPLHFKSIHSCSNQLKFYLVKANATQLHCYI